MGLRPQTLCFVGSMNDGFQVIYKESNNIKNVENCYLLLWKINLMASTFLQFAL